MAIDNKFEWVDNRDRFPEIAESIASYIEGFDKKELEKIRDSIFCVSYESNDLIVQEGSLLSGVFIVCDGLVKIGKYSQGRKKRVLRFLAPGEWFGLESLFMQNHNRNIQFARALLDSSVIYLESDAFYRFLKDHKAVLLELCRWFAREVAMLEYKLTRHSTEGALQNLSLLLLALSQKYGVETEEGLKIDLQFSRHTLANLMGVSVETVRRLIRRLKKNNIIQTEEKHITILNKKRLSAMAESPEFYVGILRDTL